MNLRIDSLGKKSPFVDSLPHLYLFTWISALWKRRCLLHRLQVDVQKSMLNERSYIWILVWTLREDVRLACVNTPGLFFGLHVPVMTHRIRQIKSKAIVVSC